MDTMHAMSAAQAARYLDADACAARYSFSSSHWRRLVDAGRAPQPARLGRLVRWSLAALEDWERAGCPSLRHAKGGAR